MYGPVFPCIGHGTRLGPFTVASFLVNPHSLFLFLLYLVILLGVSSPFGIVPNLPYPFLLGFNLSLGYEFSSLQLLSKGIFLEGGKMLSL